MSPPRDRGRSKVVVTEARTWYQDHIEERRAYKLRRREEIAEQQRGYAAAFRKKLDALRTERGCKDCGTHEGCLHFHHRDPSTKLYSISRMWGYSIRVFLEEDAKCDVLCASCHRKQHAAWDRKCSLGVQSTKEGTSLGIGVVSDNDISSDV